MRKWLNLHLIHTPELLYEGTSVIVYGCKKCGKVRVKGKK